MTPPPPTTWNEAELGDLVSLKTGKLDSNAATPDGSYPFFTCSRETFWTDEFAFDTEAVLLAGNNAAGVFPLKFFKGKFNAYQRTYVIESTAPQRLNNRFLYYSLRPKLEYFKSVSTGATTKFLTLTILRGLQLDLPPLPTQRRIASILSAYDDLIENNTRRIAILEEMARRLYDEWFVQFKFPGHEGVPMVDSEIGKVPEGWEVKTVEDTFEIMGGGTPSKKIEEYWLDGDINWYSPTDLTKSGTIFMDYSGTKITEVGLRKSSARLFPPLSVMMTSRATLGVIAINTTEASTNQGFITCRPNDEFPLYTLYHWLKANVEKFISLGTGATFKEITKGVFKTIELVVPDVETLKQFETTVGPMLDLALTLQRKNTNLRTQRDLLLPKLISGEIDVSEVDEPTEEVAA